MAFTMSHELVHYIRDISPDMFRKLTECLSEIYYIEGMRNATYKQKKMPILFLLKTPRNISAGKISRSCCLTILFILSLRTRTGVE